jgi:transposase-like protein
MIPKAQRALIIEALKANPNARAVARETGCAPSTVLRWARKAKIAVSKSGIKKLRIGEQRQIIEALKASPNARAAGRQAGVNPATVRKLAKIANIALLQGPPRKFSAEARAQIIEALKENPNASAVARKTGNISIARVAELAKEANIRLATNKGTRKKPQQEFGPQSFR